MSYSLDKTDRKLLYELDVNARQPKTQIAKSIQQSKQVISHRIKRLEENTIFLKYFTIMDISKLGFTIHKNFLRVQNLDQETEQALIADLREHTETVWVASCFGSYDLAVAIRAQDMEALDDILTALDRKYGKYISERQIATIIRGQYFTRDYLLEESTGTRERKSFFKASPTPVEMDETNWVILRELGQNARTNIVDIARLIDKSADTIRYRIKQLKEAGVIRSYNFVPNENNYPYLHYKILFGLRNVTEQRRNALIEYCKQEPNIVYIVKSLGPWEFEIDVEVEDTAELRDVMMDVKTEFNDIIKDYSTLHIYQVHKYNFCPSIPDKHST